MLVIRHGETDWNREDRFQGHADPALNTRGVQQAASLRERLRRWRIDAVYASDLQRAYHTAEVIVEGRDVIPIADSRLRERNYGRWEGLTGKDIQRLYPDSWQQWKSRFADHCPEGGEPLPDLRRRLKEFLGEVCAHHEGQTVLVVGHGGSVKSLVCAALEAPSEAFRHFRIGNASITLLETARRKVCLRRLNDLCHLTEDVT